MPYRTLGFPDYGMTNASNFKSGVTPDSNPKRGNTKMKATRLKNNVIAFLIVLSEYGITNARI